MIRERDVIQICADLTKGIVSIHALREERDQIYQREKQVKGSFNPRAP
jgi:hypothetical protein